jgi:hypothetical protein
VTEKKKLEATTEADDEKADEDRVQFRVPSETRASLLAHSRAAGFRTLGAFMRHYWVTYDYAK